MRALQRAKIKGPSEIKVHFEELKNIINRVDTATEQAASKMTISWPLMNKQSSGISMPSKLNIYSVTVWCFEEENIILTKDRRKQLNSFDEDLSECYKENL
ncbi:hypothetical protein KQX54_003030 [Cotesia glomerata]|uniref:Uncharacterized protein n=1 Tax=Cotesia glomerata TaxID=32391 RepID=A0AAV7IW68_COTGL|nr:hypothetical protein KQX54_003030 [Cotesia glomerata]